MYIMGVTGHVQPFEGAIPLLMEDTITTSLILLATGFIVALNMAHESLVQVLQVLAACNLLFLTLCIGFTWVWKRTTTLDPLAT